MHATVTIWTKDISEHAHYLQWRGPITSIEDAASEAEKMVEFMSSDTLLSIDIKISTKDDQP